MHRVAILHSSWYSQREDLQTAGATNCPAVVSGNTTANTPVLAVLESCNWQPSSTSNCNHDRPAALVAAGHLLFQATDVAFCGACAGSLTFLTETSKNPAGATCHETLGFFPWLADRIFLFRSGAGCADVPGQSAAYGRLRFCRRAAIQRSQMEISYRGTCDFLTRGRERRDLRRQHRLQSIRD